MRCDSGPGAAAVEPGDPKEKRRHMAKKRPVHEVRLGNIRAAVWANQNGDGDVWYNATISRRYRDGDEWRDATSFSREELPIVALAANKAHAWIWDRQAAGGQPEEVDE